MSGRRILLDEHIGRIFERLLSERSYDRVQAKDQFGEQTKDVELLRWCADKSIVLLTNNAKDFEALHRDYEHAGILLYSDQELPDTDPEGLARTVDEVFNQYGSEGIERKLIDLEEWYDWLYEWLREGVYARNTTGRESTSRLCESEIGRFDSCNSQIMGRLLSRKY